MKLISTLLLLIIVIAGIQQSFAQIPDSVRLYIDSSLNILKNNSLYAYRVDWPAIEKKVIDSARLARNKAATFPALKIAFNALGDKHAAFYQYDDQYRIDNSELIARYSDSIRAAWSKGPRIFSQMFGDIAYINIPYIGVGKQEDIDRYANRIYDTVAALVNKHPKGWIIDLRLNGGGNIRPMLGGLAAFFQDGIVSYYIDRDNKALDESAFYKGDFTIAGTRQATIHHKLPEVIRQTVAVLIGAGTASSGEGVAVTFMQRPDTKLFGERSAGLVNSTDGFVFNNGESYFLISTAYLGDKSKKVLPEYVSPDVSIKGNEAFSDLKNDAVVIAALKWLQ